MSAFISLTYWSISDLCTMCGNNDGYYINVAVSKKYTCMLKTPASMYTINTCSSFRHTLIGMEHLIICLKMLDACEVFLQFGSK